LPSLDRLERPWVLRLPPCRFFNLRCTEFTSRVLTHAQEGKVRLLATRIDGQVAAFALYLLDARTLHIYSNMVAPEWLTYSAGTITNHQSWRGAASMTMSMWSIGAGGAEHAICAPSVFLRVRTTRLH